MGTVNIDAADGPRIGASSAEIIETIESDGFYIWPAKEETKTKKPPPAPYFLLSFRTTLSIVVVQLLVNVANSADSSASLLFRAR